MICALAQQEIQKRSTNRASSNGKYVILSALLSICLTACSPQEYQINPKPDTSTQPREIPESQQKDYMRIIGDLKWDNFTTVDDWTNRFSECLYNRDPEYASSFQEFGDVPRYCTNPTVGGINISPHIVGLSSNSGTASGKMTVSVEFRIKDKSQFRAFVAAIKDKYNPVSEGHDETLYCSRYTCWKFELESIYATPTPYTISILDKVKIDPSEF